MSLFKSNGFSLTGKVYEKGENLCNEDFPTSEHITACLNAKQIYKISDDEVIDAEIEEIEEVEDIEETEETKEVEGDIYDTMERSELVEALIENGVDSETLVGKQVKTLLSMLREEK